MTESGSIFTVHLEDWGEAKSYKHPAPASWRLEPAEEIDCDEVKLAINDGTVFIPKSQSRHCSIQCFGSGDLRRSSLLLRCQDQDTSKIHEGRENSCLMGRCVTLTSFPPLRSGLRLGESITFRLVVVGDRCTAAAKLHSFCFSWLDLQQCQCSSASDSEII